MVLSSFRNIHINRNHNCHIRAVQHLGFGSSYTKARLPGKTHNAAVEVLSYSKLIPPAAAPLYMGIYREYSNKIYESTPRDRFRKKLNEWAKDSPVGEKRMEAAHRIRKAYDNNSPVLDLKFLKLSSLPSKIGRLANLLRLEVQHNQLRSLPETIGSLYNLNEIELQNNRLTNLPDEIGKLRSLLKLDLSDNELTTLPLSLGRLSSLSYLNVGSNPLRDFPSTMVDCTLLTYININETAILPQRIEYLQQQSRTMRANQDEEIYIERIRKWQDIAGVSFCIPEDRELLVHINEWLFRLEITHDYYQIATVAMNLFLAAYKNPTFAPHFYDHIIVDAASSLSRAPMALDNLYTMWKG